MAHECLVRAGVATPLCYLLWKRLFKQAEVSVAEQAIVRLSLQSLSFTQNQSFSCCIWIILAAKRWQELSPESGTWGWKDNSCKCHQGGRGLTSLKLPVGETDGRVRWHLTSLEPRNVSDINMQTHLIRFIWPRVGVLSQRIVTGQNTTARLRLAARLL